MKKRTMSSKMSKSHDKFAYKPENYMFQGNASLVGTGQGLFAGEHFP